MSEFKHLLQNIWSLWTDLLPSVPYWDPYGAAIVLVLLFMLVGKVLEGATNQ